MVDIRENFEQCKPKSVDFEVQTSGKICSEESLLVKIQENMLIKNESYSYEEPGLLTTPSQSLKFDTKYTEIGPVQISLDL